MQFPRTANKETEMSRKDHLASRSQRDPEKSPGKLKEDIASLGNRKSLLVRKHGSTNRYAIESSCWAS